MSFLIISSQRDPKNWVKALKEHYPKLDLEVYPEVKDPSKVEFALSWKHPHGIFRDYPNLKVIASMGAGIDHIIGDNEIPKDIQITRVVDEQLTKDMSIFVLSLILEYIRNLAQHHCSKEWKPGSYLRPEDVQVGIMGMGVLGVGVAEKLIQNKFNVTGWSRTNKEILGVTTYHGDDQLGKFLQESRILVNLLPLTSETKNILQKSLFEMLPKGAYLINVARGEHLVEDDLLEVINNGHLEGAALDVFRQEPLPKDHPFWNNKKIRVSPHIASITNPKTVVPQILDNYERMKEGKELQNVVDREKEY
ncbi:2-hydroxyacid dehydrogenase [Salinimicrobium terrae]|uniref:2-hydroxyacid dehydrogenase n=1 Tax=Salinimicrobium terrae TaxID=470866 RepID=UPI0003F54E13|nr:glyoxylate/hydroxypyruvate reductase A [Salinimicrobium terrae]